jgi:hypothetical protein
MRKIFGRCATMIRNWKVLVKAEAGDLERWAAKLECTEAQDPPPLLQMDPGPLQLPPQLQGGHCSKRSKASVLDRAAEILSKCSVLYHFKKILFILL